MNFRKLISSVLISALTLQPILAGATEYRIPLRDHIDSETVTPSGSGSGLGAVDAGDNPVPALLKVSPFTLIFDLTGGFRDTKTSFLTNAGTTPTKVTGLFSDPNFKVSHNCPESLEVGASCVISVQPTEAAVGGSSYTLAAMAPTAKVPALLTLSAVDHTRPDKTQDPTPHLQVVMSTVDLGKLAPGESAVGSATVINDGTAAATLDGIKSSVDFMSSTDCPASLAVGASCTISTRFSSTIPRRHSLSMDLTALPGGAPTPLTFIAWVTEDPAHTPALAFSDTQLLFSTLPVGRSETKTATLSNTGTAAALLAPLKSTPDFSVTSDCPDVLEAGASCAVSVTFNALVASTSPGVTLTAQAQDTVHADIGLRGGVEGDHTIPPKMSEGITFSPNPVNFENVGVGESKTISVDLAYTGTAPATISSLTIDRGAPAYSQTNTCGDRLEPNSQCSFSFSFKPAAATVYPGSLKLSFSDGSYTSLALSGVGQSANLSTSTTSLSVGTVVLPGVSKALNVSLSNSGNIPLTGLALLNTDPRLSFNYGNCTDTLQPKKGCALSVTYTPDSDGAINSSFQVTSDNGGSATFVVSGLAVRMSLAPTSLTFSDTQVGISSAVQSAILSNDGTVDIPLVEISVASGAQQFGQSNNCGTVLAAGQTCTISVQYTPGRVGQNAGSVAVSSNRSLVGTLTLSGSAVDYRLGASATSLQFPDVHVRESAMRILTLTNNAPDPTTITGISIVAGAAEYAQSNSCGDTLVVGASCVVTLQFTPVALGARPGSLAVTSSRGDFTVALNGTAVEWPLQVTPTALQFPDTMVGESSAALSVQVTNPSDNAAAIDSLGFASGGTDFAQTNTCGTTLAGGATCTIDVQFKPVIDGQRKGILTLTGPRGKYSVSMTGTGLPGVNDVSGSGSGSGSGGGFQHVAITFLDTAVGTSSAVRNATFKNEGTAPLTIQAIGIVDGESDFNQSNNCGETLAPGESCIISILFTPTALGERIGGIALVSDSGNFYFDLKGTGTGAAGEWSGYNDFGYVAVGKSVQRTFYLRNSGSQTLQDFDVNVVGDGLSIVSNGCRKAVTPALPIGSSCAVVVAYTPASWGELVNAELVASGPFVDGPVTWALKGAAPAPDLEFDPAPAPDFGTVSAGTTVTRYFVVRNKSKLPTTLAGAVQLSSSDFTLVSTNCSSGRVLAANEGCSMTLRLQAGQIGDANSATYSGTVLVQSVEGASGRLALTGASTPSPYTIALVDINNSAGDFGDIQAPATVTHTIRVVNTAQAKQTLSFEPRFDSASPEFTLGKYSSSACSAGLVLAAGEYCYMSAKVVVPAGSPPGTYSLTATMAVATNEGASNEMALTAQYTQEAYMLSLVDLYTVTPGAGAFGNVKAPASVSHTIKLINASKSKQTLTSLPGLESGSPEFTVTPYSSSVCAAGMVLAGGEFCYMTAKLTLPAGAAPGTYDLAATMVASSKEGGAASLPLTAQYTQEAYTLSLVDLYTVTPGSGAFGNVKAPATVSHTIKLTNTSQSKQTLSFLPGLESGSPEFTVTSYSSSVCAAGKVLQAGEFCYMTAKLTLPAGATPGTYDLAATMVAATTEGGAVSLPLTAQYTQEAYTLSLVDLYTVTPGVGAFGNVKAPATVSHTIKLINTSQSKQTLTAVPGLESGSPEFTVIPYSSSVCTAGKVLAAGDFCYMTAKLTLPAGTTPGTYDLAATMVAATLEGGATSLQLTAQYTQEAYTLSLVDLYTVTPGSAAFGNVKAPATVSHTVKVINSSKSTQTLSFEPRLESASPEFSISRYSSTACYAGRALVAGDYCYMTVTVTLPAGASPGTYNLAATMVAATNEGGSAELPVTAQYTQEPYTLSLVDLYTTTAGVGAFGNVKAPATVTHTIKLINTSKSKQTLAFEPRLDSASPEFTLGPYSSTACYSGRVLVAGDYCYMSAKLTLPAGSAPGTYYQSATMVAGTNEGGAVELPLTAQYTQEPYTLSLTISGGTANYGIITSGTSSSKSFLIYNRSNSNQRISDITLSGEGLSFTSNACVGQVVSAGSYCAVTVRAAAPAGIPAGGGYAITGAFAVMTAEGGAIDTPIYAQYGK